MSDSSNEAVVVKGTDTTEKTWSYFFSVDTAGGNKLEEYQAKNVNEALDMLQKDYAETEFTLMCIYRE